MTSSRPLSALASAVSPPKTDDLFFRLLLVSALSLPALIPLTTEHFFASSDGLYHVHRAIEIDQCLRDGGIICRWAPDQFLGYGTPLFNFYSPFTYYLAAGFHALGLGWLTATKAVIAVFMVLSAVGAFLYSSTFLSRNAATVAAVVYVYVPYHLVNAYYRGDIPEFGAMALFPTILWAFSRLSEGHERWQLGRYFIAAAGSYALIVLTHNLSAFIFTPILALYGVWLMIRAVLEEGGGLKRASFVGARLMGAALLAGGLCAYLALPALVEKEFVQLKGLLYVSHRDHFPALKDILP
ncbi:MAG TPA: 6-pyruvoyl-tetrahydropterin synthase-related protein, partial [Chloroflexota bacterium]|nr:6-pyruvoyl-tetrahydropterin synthase-related protein [Chloroflexota bacterium]